MSQLWKAEYENPIVLDIETYDPELTKLGPGVYHDPSAYVLGCGVYDPLTKKKHYYPLHHTDTASEREQLAEVLASTRSKVLANAGYDLDWLENRENLPVNGFIHDVQVAEPLLNSYRFSYSLEALAQAYHVPGKQTVDITAWADKIDPKRKNRAPQQYLWLMPSKVVGEYCIGDLEATYAVLQKQVPLLKEQNLLELYELECNLVRIRLMMRRNGIRIDLAERASAVDKVKLLEQDLEAKMFSTYGKFNINSSREIAPLLIGDGVKLPKTGTGQFSVTKDILAKNVNVSPLCKWLARDRALNKLRTTFLEKSIDEHICPDGRLHGEFYALKKDDAGTITGRWSGANPNLQQIPRNDEELGAMARGMFIPDEGCWYGHTDYSQIEYRVFSHYARGWVAGDDLDKQAQTMRDKFNANPHMDYHQHVIDLVKQVTGVQMSRPTAKRINFGTLYFMGKASLSNKFNIPYEEAEEVYDALFTALPFIESTRQRVVNSARLKGYVKTILGRRQRVSPMHIENDKYYPFFNYLIQGTAADVMKASLIACYTSGVYDVLKLHLLVHDETGTSIPKTKEGIEAYRAQQDLMSNTIKLKVPILAEADYGDNWGVMHDVPKGMDVFQAMANEIGVTL